MLLPASQRAAEYYFLTAISPPKKVSFVSLLASSPLIDDDGLASSTRLVMLLPASQCAAEDYFLTALSPPKKVSFISLLPRR